jgi:hypothetical protein
MAIKPVGSAQHCCSNRLELVVLDTSVEKIRK